MNWHLVPLALREESGERYWPDERRWPGEKRRFGIKTRFLDGRTPIQALLTSLVEAGDWVANYKAEDDVVSAYKLSMSMLTIAAFSSDMDCGYYLFGQELLCRISFCL